MQNFLQDRIRVSLEAERQRHKRGLAEFEILWLLLEPGQRGIAHYNQEPLLSPRINCIGTEPTTSDTKIDFYFKGAKLWVAILLNDEVDKYGKKGGPSPYKNQSRLRCFRHSAHNHTKLTLIGILRAMESCQTTLVLITNRTSFLDDISIFRIYVSLYYPEFKEEQRGKVGKIFLDKVRKERKDIMRVPTETWIIRNRRKSKR